MATGWKDIWENRKDKFAYINLNDSKELFLELKRIDGFDLYEGGISYESLIEQHQLIMDKLSKYSKPRTVFDLGCGAGAEMFLLKKEGYSVGGMDYSSNMIDTARKIFKQKTFLLLCYH